MAREGLRIVGAALTILGLLLLAYAFYMGAANGSIGSAGGIDKVAWSALLGWFLILIGPALWQGETPVTVKQRLKR